MKLIKEFKLILSLEEAIALKKFLGNVPAKFLHDRGMTGAETYICSNIWSLLPHEEDENE